MFCITISTQFCPESINWNRFDSDFLSYNVKCIVRSITMYVLSKNTDTKRIGTFSTYMYIKCVFLHYYCHLIEGCQGFIGHRWRVHNKVKSCAWQQFKLVIQSYIHSYISSLICSCLCIFVYLYEVTLIIGQHIQRRLKMSSSLFCFIAQKERTCLLVIIRAR